MAVLVLAGAAIALAAHAGLSYRALRTEVGLKEARLFAKRTAAPQRAQLAAQAAAQAAPLDTQEYAFARDTVRRLATPWDDLFLDLERAHSDRVALLAIEPDAENRTVRVSGEAKDYLGTLTYVANLAGQKTLTRVYLARHEIRRGPQQRPVSFTVSAAWREKQ